MERRMISAGFVEDALECLGRRGFDPAPVLAEAGMPEDLSGPVSNIQYARLWLAIAARMGDEFFGLGARPMRPGTFHMLCEAILHTQTLEHALKRALRFLALVLDDPSGRLITRDGLAEIVLEDRDGTRSAFAYRTYWLILMGVLCWLVGRRIPLRRVDFACSAPPNRLDYRQFFGAPVHFDEPASRLAFGADYLALPIIRDEAALRAFLRGAPANILLRYRHDQGLTARLRNRLRAENPAQWPSFEDLARELRLSPATLRRRLRAEGQSFAAIRDDTRHALARHLLRETPAPIHQIALTLGYAEPSTFHRAFVKWSGLTPLRFRKRDREG